MRPTLDINIGGIGSYVWLILLGTVAGSLPLALYYRSAKHLPAERVADLNFIAPIAGIVVAILLLGESVSLVFFLPLIH